MPSFSLSSHLPVPAEEVLATLTMKGVNAELGPWVRMTSPASFSARSILDLPRGERLFRSWILLFGFVPIDRHTFFFEAISSKEGFSECSKSWINGQWRHERKVTAETFGCRIADAVEFKSRLPFLDAMLKPVYRLVFWHRHKNLRRRCG